LEDVLVRNGTCLQNVKADCHLADDALERTIFRLLDDRGTVSINVVERILARTHLRIDLFYSDPVMASAYWRTSASGSLARRTVKLQKSLAESYASRAV
jgi:hypothetical protein